MFLKENKHFSFKYVIFVLICKYIYIYICNKTNNLNNKKNNNISFSPLARFVLPGVW